MKGKKGNVERKPLKETEKDNANKAEVQNGPVTRKIAANKQSAVISQERPSQAYNLNQKKQMITSEKQLSSCVIRPYTSIEVALDRNMENNSDNEADSSTDGGRRTPRRAPVIEDSFQERMKKWDEMDMVCPEPFGGG